MKILAFDPSMRKFGWAVLDRGKLVDHGLITQAGPSKKVPKKKRRTLAFWIGRVDEMVNTVYRDLGDHVGSADVVVIEMPRIYSRGSSASQAAKNSGAIEKLIFLVSSLRSRIMRYDMHVRIVLVYPQTWKGQVPKSLTRRRMERRYGRVIKHLDHNIVDAIGIATWFQRLR